MSLNGINNPLLTNIGPLSRPGDTARPGTERLPARAPNGNAPIDRAPSTLKPQTPIAGQAAAQSQVPSEAPAGTDPTLWSVLTSEERNYFAKTAALGPLTYGRIKAVTHPAPPTVRGGRLDVRA